VTHEAMLLALAEWIGEITGQPPRRLTPEATLVGDLDLDSLALAELGTRLWLGLGVRLRPGEMASVLTAGDVIDLVQRKLREKE
jgi:acyl carrier protein